MVVNNKINASKTLSLRLKIIKLLVFFLIKSELKRTIESLSFHIKKKKKKPGTSHLNNSFK